VAPAPGALFPWAERRAELQPGAAAAQAIEKVAKEQPASYLKILALLVVWAWASNDALRYSIIASSCSLSPSIAWAVVRQVLERIAVLDLVLARQGAVLGFMLCAVLWEDDDGRSNLRGNRSL
jgi:hypothetical protein